MAKHFWLIPLIAIGTASGASAQVPGSYQQSCGNVRQDGSLLSAVCKGADGRSFSTTIDTARCGRNGIVNVFGRLACGGVQGSSQAVRGGGYDNRDRGDDRPPGYDRPRQRPRYRDPDAPPPPRGYYGAPDDQDGGYAPPRRRRYVPAPDQGGYGGYDEQ